MTVRRLLGAAMAMPTLLVAQAGLARDGASAAGQASAAIVDPITVRAVEALQFGVIAVARSGAGSITVDPQNGAASFSGSLGPACPRSAACFASPALFDVTGQAGRHYRIDAPASAMAQRERGAGSALTVADIKVSAQSGTGSLSRGLLGNDGKDSFRVGGTLDVPAGTVPGIYRAEIAVVVSYD